MVLIGPIIDGARNMTGLERVGAVGIENNDRPASYGGDEIFVRNIGVFALTGEP